MITVVQYIPEWTPGAKFKKLAREWYVTLTNMVHVPFQFVKNKSVCVQQMFPNKGSLFLLFQEAGNVQPSYVSHSFDTITNPHDEHTVKWAAFSLYAGGSDTVSQVQLRNNVRFLSY